MKLKATQRLLGACILAIGAAGMMAAAVPEPSTYLLFSFGLAGLAVWRFGSVAAAETALF